MNEAVTTLHHPVAQYPDPFDFQFHHVAGLEGAMHGKVVFDACNSRYR